MPGPFERRLVMDSSVFGPSERYNLQGKMTAVKQFYRIRRLTFKSSHNLFGTFFEREFREWSYAQNVRSNVRY